MRSCRPWFKIRSGMHNEDVSKFYVTARIPEICAFHKQWAATKIGITSEPKVIIIRCAYQPRHCYLLRIRFSRSLRGGLKIPVWTDMERQGDWSLCLLCKTKFKDSKNTSQFAKPSSAKAPDTIPRKEMGSWAFRRTSPTNSEAIYYHSIMFDSNVGEERDQDIV